jgi:hypothetical protein
MISIQPCIKTTLECLDLPSLQLRNASNRDLYISDKRSISDAIICCDVVLCYLSHTILHSTSNEIEQNLTRYFSKQQCQQAYQHLHDCFDYVLSINDHDQQQDHRIYNIFQQYSIDLLDWTCLIPVMLNIVQHDLLSYLPLFVAHDWILMINRVENLEQINRITSIYSPIEEQIQQFNQYLTSLHELILNCSQSSTFVHRSSTATSNEQCCLRNYCAHDTVLYRACTHMDSSPLPSSSSSWSSADIHANAVHTFPGFVRNPVTNFLIPTAPANSQMRTSFVSLNDTSSSDDDNQHNDENDDDDDDDDDDGKRDPSIAILQRILTRRSSHPPTKKQVGSILVKRHDNLWIYPTGLIETKTNVLLSSAYDATVKEQCQSLFKRATSYDERCLQKQHARLLEDKSEKKTRKISVKQLKGWPMCT